MCIFPAHADLGNIGSVYMNRLTHCTVTYALWLLELARRNHKPKELQGHGIFSILYIVGCYISELIPVYAIVLVSQRGISLSKSQPLSQAVSIILRNCCYISVSLFCLEQS